MSKLGLKAATELVARRGQLSHIEVDKQYLVNRPTGQPRELPYQPPSPQAHRKLKHDARRCECPGRTDEQSWSS
jgi:hypothetical protein